MKKVILIGVLLFVASAYLGVERVQADEVTGLIWGYVTYPLNWQHNYPQDVAGIFYTDYTWTGYDDTICGALPHKYWIVNNLPSYNYRVGIYIWDCDKLTFGGRFWYNAGSTRQYDMMACADSQMD